MEKLTITLTDRAPVTIDRDLWPVLTSAKDHDGGEIEVQAHRRWTITVRQHSDGRTIVYAVFASQYAKENDRRAGELHQAGVDVVAAIKRVAASLDFSEELAQRCIANLPAEEI